MIENNQEETATPEDDGGEGNEQSDVVSLPKLEYEKLNQTLGSLKRELKDLKKPKEPKEETPKETKSSDNELLQKAFLRAAQITADEEVELALTTAKKWDMAIDKLVDDEDFKIKLDKLRTQKANELATSNIKGGGSGNSAKEKPEYWIARGTPPSRTDIPDKKARVAILRAMMENSKTGGKKFYNE